MEAREEHWQKILKLWNTGKPVMLSLPTSFGKSRIAIDLIKETYRDSLITVRILIAVPKLVLIDNWKAELEKWGIPDTFKITFTTYVSYPKHVQDMWDVLILDETHHFTENCAECTVPSNFSRVIAMSATIPKEIRWRLKDTFRGMLEYHVQARTAIDEGILPDPKVLLIPMLLDTAKVSEVIIRNRSKKTLPVDVQYAGRWSVRTIKNRPVRIHCTQQQWYNEMSSMIEWWKNKYISEHSVWQKNNWLKLAKDRLSWCSDKKEPFVASILSMLDDRRTLTFCSSIGQTERLGKYCINSRNREASAYIDMFNRGEIQHITACTMVNEGMNLVNCQIGIYANIGSSKIVEIQRLGRNLRHPKPVIIIPYFAGSREEEIVRSMLDNYNPSLVRRAFPAQVTKEFLDTFIDS